MKPTYEELELKLSDALQRKEVLESQAKRLEARSSAITDIIAERQRQIAVEGYTLQQDDTYTGGELAAAAISYIEPMEAERYWPTDWHDGSFKPSNHRRDLVKAAALLIAEIERLDRAARKLTPSPEAAAIARQFRQLNKITALPVERNQYGCWTHPAYDDFCGDREHIPTEEFNDWMEANWLEWKVSYRDESIADLDGDSADISGWEPERPEGAGWFVGSIHDTEDGAVCIWLRNVEDSAT